MESASRSSGDEDEFARAQGSSQRELSVKFDGRSGELKPSTPSTPRSKHSATEQRRRCKINDRFQTLRDLIPHKDQKRDKASFLLEVIEYVKFLQEKVQQYESYTGWSQGHEKLTTWSNNQAHGDGMSDPHLPKNGPSHTGFYFPGRIVENSIPMIPSSLANTQNVAETDVPIGMDAMHAPIQSNYYSSVEKGSGLIHPLERLISDSDNLMSQSQSEWQRSSFAADCTGSSDMLNEQEELAIDEGTISISSAYSQGLLNALSQAVTSYGIDLSEASISVQINLGRRANRRSVANATSREKDHENQSLIHQQDAGGSRAGSNGEDSEHAHKRQKVDDS